MTTVLKSNDICWCGSGRRFKRRHRPSTGTLRPGLVSARRSVPDSIERPDYAADGLPKKTEEPLVRSSPTRDPFSTAKRVTIEEGMTFTIEPMVNAGGWQDRLSDDEWTAVTADGSRSAQFEHTLLVTGEGADVLTTCPR